MKPIHYEPADFTIRQLKAIAKEHKIAGYSRLTKQQLCEALNALQPRVKEQAEELPILRAIAEVASSSSSLAPQPEPQSAPAREPNLLHLAVAAAIYGGRLARRWVDAHYGLVLSPVAA